MTSMILKNHFQVAYVARDVDEGMARLGKLFGVTNWHVMDMKALAGDQSRTQRIALAYAGNHMVEIIEPNPDVTSLYTGWTLDDPAAPRFHHLGYLFHNDDDYNTAKQQLADQGIACAVEGGQGDILEFHYADLTRELGHFYELIYLKSAGKDFFAHVPQN